MVLSLTLDGEYGNHIEYISVNSLYQIEWENYWYKHNNDYSSDNIKVHYFTSLSFGNEMTRIVFVDIPILGVSVILMGIYLSMTLGKNFNCVEARVLLAMGSLFSIVCALLIGLGIGLVFGYPFNPVILMVPFLLLGVGVDDGIIIVETFDHTELQNNDIKNNDVRFANAMKHSGLSITLTSLSSIVAFGIGSNIDMPGVGCFCIYSMLTFVSNYS